MVYIGGAPSPATMRRYLLVDEPMNTPSMNMQTTEIPRTNGPPLISANQKLRKIVAQRVMTPIMANMISITLLSMEYSPCRFLLR